MTVSDTLLALGVFVVSGGVGIGLFRLAVRRAVPADHSEDRRERDRSFER